MRSTEGARGLGRRLAPAGLIAAGFLLTLAGYPVGGLALLVAGWMARAAVRAADRRDRLARLLDGLTVGDVMETSGPTVPPTVTIDAFVPALDAATEAGAVWVLEDGELVGIVGAREVARVPRRRWSEVRAAEAMTATAGLPRLGADEPLAPAAERLGRSGATGFPVHAEGRAVGILTRFAVGRTLQERLAPGGDAVSADAATQPPAVDAGTQPPAADAGTAPGAETATAPGAETAPEGDDRPGDRDPEERDADRAP